MFSVIIWWLYPFKHTPPLVFFFKVKQYIQVIFIQKLHPIIQIFFNQFKIYPVIFNLIIQSI